MQDFILTLLFNIQGIGAASGLVYNDGRLMLISDNSNCLYSYDMKPGKLSKKALEPYGIAENIPKKDKPDYEAMALADGKVYLFGSGSTQRRNYTAIISADQTQTSIFDLSKLYAAMRKAAGISTDDFNIEGVTRLGAKWFFFLRGNGPKGNNGVFLVTGNITGGDDFSVSYHAIPLPDCNGMPATFTDAVAVDNLIYFVGTAENSNSVYHDGEILGSMIGCLDPETMKVIFTKQITKTHKFEGLALFKKTEKEITFLLCEDNDTEVSESGIYELRLIL